MKFLSFLPAILSLLVLGAHFLRAAYYPLVLAALLVIGLLFLRHPASRRVVQLALIAGALEWVRVTFELVAERKLWGMPYTRMAIILGGVAVFTVLSALLLNTRRVIEWFDEDRSALHEAETIPQQ